jgi:anti-anti-sigma factor
MAVSRGVTRAAFIRNTSGGDEYVHVFGEVDIESDEEFRAAIREAAKTAKRVIIDLTRCTYIGSQGFAVLVDAQTLNDIAVLAPLKVQRLMQILGLSGLLIDAPRGFGSDAGGAAFEDHP